MRHVPRYLTTTDDTGRPVTRCTTPGCGEETATTNPTWVAAWKRQHARVAQSPVSPVRKAEPA